MNSPSYLHVAESCFQVVMGVNGVHFSHEIARKGTIGLHLREVLE